MAEKPNPETPPEIPADEVAAHSAATDEALSSILGDLDDDPDSEVPDVESNEGEVAEEGEESDEGEIEAEEAGEEAEEEDVLGETDTDSGYTEDQRFDAIQALRRDGLSASAINTMDEAEMVTHGLKRHAAQAKNDEVYRERDRLAGQLGSGTQEATRDTSGAGDSASSEASDPAMTGADLTSLALPVAKSLAEMEDPEKVASVLADFAKQAIEDATGGIRREMQALQGIQVEQHLRTIRAELGADFEGDFDTLAPEASKLGAAGLHGDKSGIDRAVALFRSAQLLATGGVQAKKQTTRTSTSRARKRGAAPPVNGRKTPARKLKPDEVVDRKLAAILNGETDIEKLRTIG